LALVWLAAASMDRGDPAGAKRRLELVAREVLDSTDLQVRSTALAHDTMSLILDGRGEEGLNSCAAWIDNQFTQEDPKRAAGALQFGSRIAREYGLVEGLSNLVARFDAVPERQRPRDLIGALSDARGIAAAAKGDEDVAMDAFGIGLAAARSAGDRWMTAEILSDYGLALLSFGRADEAEPLLDEAQGLWGRMGANAWLKRPGEARAKVSTPA
jgi:hypothetical protein